MSDPINPDHYRRRSDHPSRVECIELLERMPALLANAVKYLYRAGVKTPSPVADLRKAAWYLERAARAPRAVDLKWNGVTRATRGALLRWRKAATRNVLERRVRTVLQDILYVLEGGPRNFLVVSSRLLLIAADAVERNEIMGVS